MSQVLLHPAKGGSGFELLRRGGGQSEEEVEKGDDKDLETLKLDQRQRQTKIWEHVLY